MRQRAVTIERYAPTMIGKNLTSVVRLQLVALHFAYGLVLDLCVYPNCKNSRRQHIRQRWCAQLLNILGIRLSVNAANNHNIRGGGLIICNHISFIDIIVINAFVPTIFVAKSEVRNWPLIGWSAARAGALFIERGRPKSAYVTYLSMRKCLRESQSVTFFPEGTTTNGETVNPFYSALFQSAVDIGAPVHCLALRYLDKAGRPSTKAAFIGDMGFLQSLWNTVSSGGLKAHLHLLPPIDSRQTDRKSLAYLAHHKISKQLTSAHPLQLATESAIAKATLRPANTLCHKAAIHPQ